MQINLEFPIARREKLQQLADRLPEVLDRALQELIPVETIPYQHELCTSHFASRRDSTRRRTILRSEMIL